MFSSLVDRAIHIAGRPDALEDMAYAANEVMRDLSKRSDWDDDLIEEVIQGDPSSETIEWLPEVGRSRFRREEYIEDACGCNPARVRPSARMNRSGRAIYYKSGESFIFARTCAPIAIAYWAYQPWLQYYPKGARPAEFNIETQDWDGATEEQIAAVSNWLLERHNQVVLDGTLASFFKTKSDPRQQVHFSSYEQKIVHMVSAESARQLLARR